jgi:hypothetical protein
MYFKGMLWSAMIWCDGILLAVGYGFIVVQLDGCFISKNNVFKFLVGSYQFFTKIYSFSTLFALFDQHCLGNLSPVTTVSTKPPSFKKICQEDIETIQTVLGEICNMSSRDIQRVLQEKNVNTSLTTVRKAIDAAGFVSTKV